MSKLTEKGKKVLDYVREHDNGDGVLLTDIAEGTGLSVKAVGPIVWTSLKEKKDGSRPALVIYEKRNSGNDDGKTIGYVHITTAGAEWVDTEDEVEIAE
jgi:hypothetical protein